MNQQYHTTQIPYEESICAFVDILGFRELVKNKDPKIDRYLGAINHWVEFYKNSPMIKFLAISDCVIISSKVDFKEKEAAAKTLRLIFEIVARLQWDLASHGIWTRGGVARGNLYFDSQKNIIVGDAFIKAYEIESKAKVPRVVIDTELVRAMESSNIKQFRDEMNKIRLDSAWGLNTDVIYDHTKSDMPRSKELCADTPLFVDWGNCCISQIDNGFYPTCFWQLQHDITGKLEHYEKYYWLAGYLSIKGRTISVMTGNKTLLEAANHIEFFIN